MPHTRSRSKSYPTRTSGVDDQSPLNPPFSRTYDTDIAEPPTSVNPHNPCDDQEECGESETVCGMPGTSMCGPDGSNLELLAYELKLEQEELDIRKKRLAFRSAKVSGGSMI